MELLLVGFHFRQVQQMEILVFIYCQMGQEQYLTMPILIILTQQMRQYLLLV